MSSEDTVKGQTREKTLVRLDWGNAWKPPSVVTPFPSNGQQTVVFLIGPTDKFSRLYQL